MSTKHILEDQLDKLRMLNELELVRRELVKIRKDMVLGSTSQRIKFPLISMIRARRVKKYNVILSDMISECDTHIQKPCNQSVSLMVEKRSNFINRHIASVLTLQH